MLENLQSLSLFSPSVSEILINLSVSLICSFIISLIYKYTYNGIGYSQSFVNSIIFLSLITSMVIMIIGNNLARAFGLVGALSIIRFRTAIKDTSDIVYIFLGLGLGMSAGVGYHKLAIIGTLFIGTVLILFSKSKNEIFKSGNYLLQFTYKSAAATAEKEFPPVLDNFCSRFEIVNVRSDEFEGALIYSYHVQFKRGRQPDDFIRALQSVPGTMDVNIFFDQQTI